MTRLSSLSLHLLRIFAVSLCLALSWGLSQEHAEAKTGSGKKKKKSKSSSGLVVGFDLVGTEAWLPKCTGDKKHLVGMCSTTHNALSLATLDFGYKSKLSKQGYYYVGADFTVGKVWGETMLDQHMMPLSLSFKGGYLHKLSKKFGLGVYGGVGAFYSKYNDKMNVSAKPLVSGEFFYMVAKKVSLNLGLGYQYYHTVLTQKDADAADTAVTDAASVDSTTVTSNKNAHSVGVHFGVNYSL
ncbi:MAG: hypothetical protein OXC40_01255 [Proteobacteria bacterium]|nr:hypothetical protein [Pseudomonadota bacterium]